MQTLVRGSGIVLCVMVLFSIVSLGDHVMQAAQADLYFEQGAWEGANKRCLPDKAVNGHNLGHACRCVEMGDAAADLDADAGTVRNNAGMTSMLFFISLVWVLAFRPCRAGVLQSLRHIKPSALILRFHFCPLFSAIGFKSIALRRINKFLLMDLMFFARQNLHRGLFVTRWRRFQGSLLFSNENVLYSIDNHNRR